MEERILQERERALENVFFAQQDRLLLAKLREADVTRSRVAALAAASGITDDALLGQILALGLGPGSIAALALAPLVLVAWADGALDPKERDLVREAARQAGLDGEGEAGAVLEAWLSRPPAPELLTAWRGYLRALAAGLGEAARVAMQRETMARARRVAEAAGGTPLLGWGVSEAEARMLAELEAAFAG
jgi:hypothetical protein